MTNKHVIKGLNEQFYDSKKKCRLYNIPVKYTRKAFEQSFVNYLGLVYLNSMPCLYKKNFTVLKLILLA